MIHNLTKQHKQVQHNELENLSYKIDHTCTAKMISAFCMFLSKLLFLPLNILTEKHRTQKQNEI